MRTDKSYIVGCGEHCNYPNGVAPDLELSG